LSQTGYEEILQEKSIRARQHKRIMHGVDLFGKKLKCFEIAKYAVETYKM